MDITKGIIMIEGNTADHSHGETVGYHSEHQINSKYERKIRHVPTQQHFQPQHFVDCPGYAAYYTNTQHTEPTLSVPSQHPDLIKHIDSNQQMMNYHVPINPVYVGPYHQFKTACHQHLKMLVIHQWPHFRVCLIKLMLVGH